MGFSTAFAFLSLIALVKSFLSIITPSSEGPALSDASLTSPALSPKIARRSFLRVKDLILLLGDFTNQDITGLI